MRWNKSGECCAQQLKLGSIPPSRPSVISTRLARLRRSHPEASKVKAGTRNSELRRAKAFPHQVSRQGRTQKKKKKEELFVQRGYPWNSPLDSWAHHRTTLTEQDWGSVGRPSSRTCTCLHVSLSGPGQRAEGGAPASGRLVEAPSRPPRSVLHNGPRPEGHLMKGLR